MKWLPDPSVAAAHMLMEGFCFSQTSHIASSVLTTTTSKASAAVYMVNASDQRLWLRQIEIESIRRQRLLM